MQTIRCCKGYTTEAQGGLYYMVTRLLWPKAWAVGRYSVYWICFLLEIKTSCKAYFSFAFELRAGEQGHLKVLEPVLFSTTWCQF